MTKLEKEIKKRKISWYQLSKIMGKSPQSMASKLKEKVQGKKRIEFVELKDMCLVISNYSDMPLSPDELQYDIDVVTLK